VHNDAGLTPAKVPHAKAESTLTGFSSPKIFQIGQTRVLQPRNIKVGFATGIQLPIGKIALTPLRDSICGPSSFSCSHELRDKLTGRKQGDRGREGGVVRKGLRGDDTSQT